MRSGAHSKRVRLHTTPPYLDRRRRWLGAARKRGGETACRLQGPAGCGASTVPGVGGGHSASGGIARHHQHDVVPPLHRRSLTRNFRQCRLGSSGMARWEAEQAG